MSRPLSAVRHHLALALMAIAFRLDRLSALFGVAARRCYAASAQQLPPFVSETTIVPPAISVPAPPARPCRALTVHLVPVDCQVHRIHADQWVRREGRA